MGKRVVWDFVMRRARPNPFENAHRCWLVDPRVLETGSETLVTRR